MYKSTLPQGVRTLLSWLERGTLSLDADIQRSIGQWNNLQQSLLVHSILAGYPIPPIYLRKVKDGDTTKYLSLEGNQRLSTLAQFCSEESFALNSATPEVVVDDVTYDLANLTFHELSEECKDAILGFRFTIYCIEDATDEEIAEIFARLNNSTPLTKIQQCRGVLGFEISRWCREMNEMPFFNQALSLSAAQARREATLEILLQSMLLLDARHEGYEYKGISANDVAKYCQHIKEAGYNDDKMFMILEIVDYLSEAFETKHKWLKKTNVPMVFVLAKCALENGISSEDFKSFIDSFSNAVCPEYEMNTGSGNVKRGKTEGRLKAIASVFEDYFHLEDIHILSTQLDGTSSPKGEAETQEQASEEVAEAGEQNVISDENSELSEEVQSLDEESRLEDVVSSSDDSDDVETNGDDSDAADTSTTDRGDEYYD